MFFGNSSDRQRVNYCLYSKDEVRGVKQKVLIVRTLEIDIRPMNGTNAGWMNFQCQPVNTVCL